MAARYVIVALVVGLLCLAAAAVLAQTPDRVPHINEAGQQSYQRYLQGKNGRAFAISERGAYGWGDGWGKIEGAINSAMEKCRKDDPIGCRLYSLNGQVVWGMSVEAAISRVAPAQARPVATGEVPFLKSEGQRDYERYKLAAFHRAFYISEGGGYGAGTNGSTPESAHRIAKQNCEKRDPKGVCRPYSADGYVVWNKDPASIPRYADAPKLGRFIPSDYTPVAGPQRAKGLIVWSHGYRRGSDATASQPHGYVSRFLADGWDVYRFNREWVTQSSADVQDMIDSVAAARAAGYKKVVLAGQSHGAWSSLAALGRGVQADGIVATAPATHGSPPSRAARSDFQQLLRDIRSRNAADIPVVITLFEDDSFDPGGRFADVKSILGGTAIPLKFIEHPSGFKGHSAGDDNRFNDVFGRCIFSFIARAPTATEDCK